MTQIQVCKRFNLHASMDKKMISPYIELCIGKWPGFCTIFVKKHIVPKAKYYALFRSYFDFGGYFFLFVCPNCALGPLTRESLCIVKIYTFV